MAAVGFDATNILGHGGIKTYARQLIRAVAAEGPALDIRLFTTWSRSRRERLQELFDDLPGISVHSGLPHARMLGEGLRWLNRLAGTMAWRVLARRVDLIHLTDPYSSAALPSRFISTVHDLFPLSRSEYEGTPLRKGYLRTTPVILTRSSVVIVPSAFVCGEISRLYPGAADKIRVVPEAAGGEFVPAPSTTTAEGEAPYLLFVGRPDPRKNLKGILAAFQRVSAELPELRLKLVLSGSDSAALHEGVPEDRIDVMRDVSTQELVSLYSGALVFLFPSLGEGFGLPVLEAMRCGCPVITSDSTSLPEVAGDSALLVDPGSAAEIASAIEKLSRSPELRSSLSLSGLRRASAYTWRRTAAQTLRIYGVGRHFDPL